MFDEVERVRERRRERIERIRTLGRDAMPPYAAEWNDPVDGDVFPSSRTDMTNRLPSFPPGPPSRERITAQMAGSLLLIGAAYVLFQSDIPLPSAWKERAREVMTRDFNFAGVTAWYQERFGNAPSVLPVLTPKTPSSGGKATDGKAAEGESPDRNAADGNAANGNGGESQPAVAGGWQTPATWRLEQAYDPGQGYVVWDVGASGIVTGGETGWVTFVGEKPGFGRTVVVQLARGREVWYGHLERIDVALNDWVEQGEAIGVAAEADGRRELYLGFRQGARFVDPADVIVLE